MNPVPDAALYDRDFLEWTQRNVDLFRRGCVEKADLTHIAEEIEDLGKRDQGAVESEVLVMHLLKWRYQPAALDPRILSGFGDQASIDRTRSNCVSDRTR